MSLRAAAFCAFSLAACGSAPSAAPPSETRATTHEVAACLQSADPPICLLKARAKGPVHLPYRHRAEFIGATEVLAALESDDSAAERRVAASDDVLDRTSLGPFLEQQRLVAEALAADRRGEPPEQALAPLKTLGQGLERRSFALGQIVTASGAELRSGAYGAIWRAYRDGSAAARPGLPLTRAALAAWEAELLASGADAEDPRGVITPWTELAEAYAALGDAAGLARVRARRPEAVPAAVPDLTQRSPAALRHAEAELERYLAGDYGVPMQFEPVQPTPVDRLLAQAPPGRLLQWAERLDAVARRTGTLRGINTAEAAAVLWVRLGRPDRAEALITLWRPLADAQRGRTCGGEGQAVCVIGGVSRMMAATDRIDEAFSYGEHNFTARDAVLWDLQNGRGLQRLDAHLARAQRPYDRVAALRACAEQAGHKLPSLLPPAERRRRAETCVLKLLALPREDRLLISGTDVVDGQAVDIRSDAGVESALRLGAAGGREGDLRLMRDMLTRALTLWREGPDQEIGIFEGTWLEQIAVAELRAAGRLPR